VDAGLSVIPVGGNKKPIVPWASFQKEPPTDRDINTWFAREAFGVALVNGAVSGNRETMDFDDPPAFHAWYEGIPTDLGQRLAIAQSPSGGFHVHYACDVIAGNQKLAMNALGDVAIETRGEGGYVILPPSRGYDLLAGDLCDAPKLTIAERALLHDAARSLDRCPRERPTEPPTVRQSATDDADERPGDRYNRENGQAEVVALLEAQGWHRVRRDSRGNVLVLRPGDTDAESSGNVSPSGVLHVFSTNAYPFETERSYDPFGVYATLGYGGDYQAASRSLYQEYHPPARNNRRSAAKVVDIEGHAVDTATGEVVADAPTRRALTDLGNAERLIDRHSADVRYSAPLGWLVFDGARWQRDEAGRIVTLAKKTVRDALREASDADDYEQRKSLAKHALKSESAASLANMVQLAKTEEGVPIRVDDLDSDPWLLTVANGTLDFRTGELREHRREDFITKSSPVTYDPDATCPHWMTFLRRIMGDDESLVAYVQRAIGYSLTGDTSERAMFVLHGGGGNGKSTLLSVISEIAGDFAVRTPTETLMIKHNDGVPNDVARLRGARFAFASEAEEDKRLAEARIKDLTGGDRLTARFMREEWFDFEPTFKIWLATNHRPVVRGTDQAIWDRLRLIPFNVVIPENERRPKHAMLAELRAEYPGILAWAVCGCLDWQRGGLGTPQAVTEATRQYRDDMDSLGIWIAEECIESPIVNEQSAPLYDAFKRWCENGGERAITHRAFGMRLVERGYGKQRATKGVSYSGIRLRLASEGASSAL
jgi:P4 family phage/plasmid primase-like protien